MSKAPSKVILEICVQGITSALAAHEGGADRIELCEDLAVGGVTPSSGVVAIACERLAIPVHVLIRPRGGDFVYSAAEGAVIERDIATAKGLGAAGVVLGVLTEAGTVDCERTARMIALARPLSVTFHKAFDDVRDPLGDLERLVALGVDRVLTSGQAATAREGRQRLAELHRRAAGRLVIMAGGRIAGPDLAALIASGLGEIHVGSAAGAAGRTDPGKVRRLVEDARAAISQDECCSDNAPS